MQATSNATDNKNECTDADVCGICFDEDSSEDWAWLPCGHGFHAKCLVRALCSKINCPYCRRIPKGFVYVDPEDEDQEEHDDESSISFISFKEGYRIGCENAKQTKRGKRSLETIAKWKKLRKEAFRTKKQIRQQFKPLEKELDLKFREMEKEFRLEHAALFKSLNDAKALYRRACVNHRKARERMAAKGGWIFNPYDE